jgi:hypothetical protein
MRQVFHAQAMQFPVAKNVEDVHCTPFVFQAQFPIDLLLR